MSRSTKATSPPTTVHPTAVVAPAAILTGTYPITIGANTIIHPRATLTSKYGPVSIGNGCIIGERSVVGLQSKSSVGDKGVVVGNGVTIESGAKIQGSIEDSSVVEIGAVAEMGSIVGKVGRKLQLSTKNLCTGCPKPVASTLLHVVPPYTLLFRSPFDHTHCREGLLFILFPR